MFKWSKFGYQQAGLMLAAWVMANVAAAATAEPIKVADGWVQGSTEATLEVYKGIPYAAAPVGALRWRPPQALAPWPGVRDATRFGADCMQDLNSGDVAVVQTQPSEDCLFLNVWRPQHAHAKLPVMVWIYGGGFVNGGSSAPIYSGAGLAAQGVIVVSMNYRLGRLGFFAFPALTREWPQEPKGNYAFLDQIAALQWVKRNIAAFGGDPQQVTLFGESAGGMSVHALIASPLARGLFQRAIIQSAAGRGTVIGPERQLSRSQNGLDSAEVIGQNFARSKGIAGTDAVALAALRALPPDQLVDGLSIKTLAMLLGSSKPPTFAAPVLDGKLLHDPPDRAYQQGRAHLVPLLIGATSSDLSLVRVDSKAAAFALLGPAAKNGPALYDPDGKQSYQQLAEAIGADRYMVEPARFVARRFAASGETVYAYRFGYTAAAQQAPPGFGAFHATDIPYSMATLIARYGLATQPRDQAVAAIASGYWVNFARHGDPNGPGLAPWPRYQPASDQILQFLPDGSAVAARDPWQQRLDLISGLASH